MNIPSALPSAANVAAALMLASAASLAAVPEAPAAEHGRTVTAQRAAPMHHYAPAFHPSLTQYGPRGGNTNRPVYNAPVYTPPQQQHNFQPHPEYRHPEYHHPEYHNPLPFNNPSALRPNYPVNTPGGQSLPANTPGGAAPAAAAGNQNPVQQGGAIPSQATAIQPVLGQPAGQPPASVSVVKPLLKSPPGGFLQTKPAFPAALAHDRFWPIHRDARFMWLRGQRRLFTPVAALGVVLIGGSYWYPDAYVSAEGPACTGYTGDGCQLQWRTVDLEDGGAEPQCVQYCPQAGPPPEQVATLPPPPAPAPEGGTCQATIYSEPNFRGNSAPTGDSQPVLSPTGWRNEIASIVVRAGTWDFFADENYGGESLRLGPGTYPTLAPEWTRHIGSFMCVEPG